CCYYHTILLFTPPAPLAMSTLSLHDALPILRASATSLLVETGEKTPRPVACARLLEHLEEWLSLHETEGFGPVRDRWRDLSSTLDRKSTRLNSSHLGISYAVFCLKKKINSQP